MKRQRETRIYNDTTTAAHNTRFYTQVPREVWCTHILMRLDVTSIFRFAAASRHFMDMGTIGSNESPPRIKPTKEIDGCVISLYSIITLYRTRFNSGRHDQRVCIDNELVVRFPHLIVLYLDDDICSVTDEALSQLSHLRVLNLGYDTRITDRGLSLLTELSVLELCDHNTQVTDASLSRLVKLSNLNLEWNGTITDAGLRCLDARLQTLNLAHNSGISDDGLKWLTGLTELHLSGNVRITDAGLSTLTRLTRLRLLNTRSVTDATLSLLTGLERLTISLSPMTDRSLCCLTRLRHLRLYNRIDGVDGSALSCLGQLKFLCIAHINNIRDEALQQMARTVTTLRKLELGPNTSITDNAVSCFTLLDTLSLRGNTVITDRALPPLASSLTCLSLVRNECITLEGLGCLQGLKRLLYHNAKNLVHVHHTTLQQLLPGLTGSWSEYQVQRSEEEREAHRNDIVLDQFV